MWCLDVEKSTGSPRFLPFSWPLALVTHIDEMSNFAQCDGEAHLRGQKDSGMTTQGQTDTGWLLWPVSLMKPPQDRQKLLHLLSLQLQHFLVWSQVRRDVNRLISPGLSAFSCLAETISISKHTLTNSSSVVAHTVNPLQREHYLYRVAFEKRPLPDDNIVCMMTQIAEGLALNHLTHTHNRLCQF